MRSLSVEKTGTSTTFRVWAPMKEAMVLHLVHPKEERWPMTRSEEGYWQVSIEGIEEGTLYFFQPDHEKDLPDPASNYQPDGVHGPSQVINHSAYKWNDDGWKGVPLEDWMAHVDVLAFTDNSDKTQVGIEIHSGRNRIVRRIFEHYGYDVKNLDRVVFAGLTKKNVDRGKWRFLTEKEVRDLKYFKKGKS